MELRFERLREWLVPASSLPLEKQFFQGLCLLGGGIGLFVVLPVNQFQNLSPWVDRVVFILALELFALAWAARHGHFLKTTALVSVVAALDLIWFPNGGSQASIGLYFFPVALFLMVIFEGAARVLALILLLANIFGLLLAERIWPNLVVLFNPTDRLLDLLTGYVLSTLTCVLMLWVVLAGFTRERKHLAESESLYRDLLTRQGEGFGMVDAEERFLLVNPVAEEIFGVPPGHLLGRSLMEFLPDAQAERVRNESLLRAQGTASTYELTIHRPDGSLRTLLVTATPRASEKDEALQVIGVFRDITDRKQAEIEKDQLEAENRQLQKAESLGRMAAAIAHHFNNKLQSVMTNLELLRELPPGTDPLRCLTRATQATEKVAEVSAQMLVYLGQASSERKPRLLAELCRESLPRLQAVLPETQRIAWNAPTPGPLINADGPQIQQALTCLVTNAWEALGDGAGTIRITLRTCSAADIPTQHRFPIGWQPQQADHACLEVLEDGCGIAEADIEKLFDPFFSTKSVGRGLGLPVVLGIVQSHGGVITVNSQRGQGSCFRIHLPLSTETAPSLQEPVVPTPPSQAGGTILVVDDDPMLLEAAGALVKMLGFRVLTAKDGVEALEVFAEKGASIRCVITDLTMPRLDGWQTLAALREFNPALPVILSSGYDKAHVMAGVHENRPQAFLGKPYRLKQLREAIDQALEVS